MVNNFLQIKDKTEIIVFGPPRLRAGLIKELGNHFTLISSRNLGIIMDPEFCLTKQIHLVVKNSCY